MTDTDSFLRERLLRLGVSQNGLDTWAFSDNCSRDMLRLCQRQVDYVEHMKAAWRDDNWLRLPAEWMPGEEHATLPKYKEDLPGFNIALLIEPVRDRVKKLERSEILDEHFSSTKIGPDFCLNVYHCSPSDELMSLEESLRPNTNYSKCLVSQFLLYNGLEGSAERSISCLFTGAPGCWFSCNPRTEFPPALCTTPPHTACNFALLHHPFASSTFLHRQQDRNLRISISHPLLLVGMKGPTPWIRGAAGERELSRETLLQDLSCHIQPAINLLLISWKLQESHKFDAEIPQLLPEDAVVFGILFDSSKIELVAHIPFWDSESSGSTEKYDHSLRYLSYTVDSLDFPTVPSVDDERGHECIISRLRVAMALLTIQRHAFRLTRFWDGIVLPQYIRDSEDAREELSLGPILERPLTPSVEDSDEDEDSDDYSDSDNDGDSGHDDDAQKLSDAALQSYIEDSPDYLTTIKEWRIGVQDEEDVS